jgi:phosphate transport system substrate-binding protein
LGRGPALLALCALLAYTLLACAPTPTPNVAPSSDAPEPFQVAGSTAAAPLLDLLGPAFKRRHPEIAVVADEGLAQANNAGQVLALVAEGTTSLGIVVGTDAPSATGSELWSAPVAVDAIAVIVHRDNPVRSLTRAQLYQVFTGRTWRWSALSGNTQAVGDEITVVSRERNCGTRAAFVDQALRTRPDLDPTPITTMAVLQMSSAEVVAYVAEHAEAIGYVALAAIDVQSNVRAIAVEDVAPGPEPVSHGRYPFSLPLYFVAQEEPTGAARTFLDFCLSTEGQQLIARQYAPVR